MPQPSSHHPASSHPFRLPRATAVVAILAGMFFSCDSRHPEKPAAPASATDPKISGELALARIALAREALQRHEPQSGLCLLASALAIDPSCKEALELAGSVLTKTRWTLPETTVRHHLPVEHVEMDASRNLWVSLAGNSPTVLRWNMETDSIESILFPTHAQQTRTLIFDHNHASMVIERDETSLLCDAQSLKPIRRIGPLPDFLNPQTTIVFSEDGLLLAHPAFSSTTDRSLVWHLRDAKTGEIIRSSPPSTADAKKPVAAFVDRSALKVLHTDGSLMIMPVYPAQEITRIPTRPGTSFVHALFYNHGQSVEALNTAKPFNPPERATIQIDPVPPPGIPPDSLLEQYPWSSYPNLWNGLMREEKNPPVMARGHQVTFPALGCASFAADSAITAVALHKDRLAIGEQNGTLTILRLLPPPRTIPQASAQKNQAPPGKPLEAFLKLTQALTGFHPEKDPLQPARISAEDRYKCLRECDFAALEQWFPQLDFAPTAESMRTMRPHEIQADALLPMWDRIARADSSGTTWKNLLETSKDRANNQWRDGLAAAVRAVETKEAPDPGTSPWLGPWPPDPAFFEKEIARLAALPESSRVNGPKAAKSLEFALSSQRPDWIATCLNHADNLPPFLQQLALSHIAWLENRKADAMSLWPEEFPDFDDVRTYQDWDGWEQADFSPAYREIHKRMTSLLDELAVTPDSSAEQRAAVTEKFKLPETAKAIGRTRFAKACLKAALAFAKFKEEKETTFHLAALARDLGEAPEPCLRAEATALTSLGQFRQAHERWIRLITEHPVANQEPGDYAEAAYTAFENANPQQAMAILTTGIHRFPNDANFALRAGWVALLTGNPDRAYRFLLNGQQIGYPEEKRENATALLAIAAAQSGAMEDATAFCQSLVDLDPDWKKPGTIESLEWPAELKSCLLDVMQSSSDLLKP